MAEWLTTADWKKLFTPEMTLPEVLIWGGVLYLALIVLLRVVPKREFGSTSVSDILFIVLVGGVTTEALGKHGGGALDFVLLLAVVMVLNYLVEWLMFRVPFIHRLMEEEPTSLIRDGKVLKDQIDREMITEDELKAQLRLHEVEDPAEVKEAKLESDGELSVIKKKPAGEEGSGNGQRNGYHGAGVRRNGPYRPATTAPDGPSTGEGGATAAGEKEPVPESVVQDFLAAADRLRERLDWHRAQADRHQAEAAELKRLLARHGVRTKATRPSPT